MATGEAFQMAGYNLPLPQKWQVTAQSRATLHQGMDGTVIVDRRAGVTTSYQEVSIQWNDATDDERADIEAAWIALLEAGSVTFVDIHGDFYTATYAMDTSSISIMAYQGFRDDDPGGIALFEIAIKVRLEALE